MGEVLGKCAVHGCLRAHTWPRGTLALLAGGRERPSCVRRPSYPHGHIAAPPPPAHGRLVAALGQARFASDSPQDSGAGPQKWSQASFVSFLISVVGLLLLSPLCPPRSASGEPAGQPVPHEQGCHYPCFSRCRLSEHSDWPHRGQQFSKDRQGHRVLPSPSEGSVEHP